MKLDSTYWDSRYLNENTGWDIGFASPALLRYCNDLALDTRILIPGAGRSHEYLALREQGFANTYVLDYAPSLILGLKSAHPEHSNNILCEDFFTHQGQYDLILEQTFFCALDPSLRRAYVNRAHELLSTKGKLAGLYFNRLFDKAGPPFGGSALEYEALLKTKFRQVNLDYSPLSIEARKGSEVFIESIK